MSIKLMSKVWEHGPEDKTETLVLLALADRANDDGTSCYPSLDEITNRCRLSRQGALNVIDRLEENGYLTKQSGGGRGNPNQYRLHPNALKGSSSLDGFSSEKGKADKQKGKADKAKGSSSLDGNRHEPSNNRQGSAPARGDDPAGVQAWVDVTGERPTAQTRQMLRDELNADDAPTWDAAVFRDVLKEAWLNVGRDAHRIRVGYLLSSYEQALARKRARDGGRQTTRDGKVKGPDQMPDVEYNARGYRIQ